MKASISNFMFMVAVVFIVIAVFIDEATSRKNIKAFYEGMTEGINAP